MKKIFLALVLAVSCLFLVTACEETLVDPNKPVDPSDDVDGPTLEELVDLVEGKYAKIGEATEIWRNVEIKHGALTQYESKRSYKKEGDGYTVTGTVKTLNTTDAAEAYSTTSVNETVGAGTFVSELNLNASYFTAMDVKDGVFVGEVGDGYYASVFGIGESLPAPVHGLTLKIVTDETHVGEIGITYVSGSSDVSIVLTFEY